MENSYLSVAAKFGIEVSPTIRSCSRIIQLIEKKRKLYTEKYRLTYFPRERYSSDLRRYER
jgi:hypothetical protein